ncbi:hypothetical protein DIPPA_12620 [Diplonema papillatum]|nr:hypothetical protein DIPPA_12620 [Diplonema papillatum]
MAPSTPSALGSSPVPCDSVPLSISSGSGVYFESSTVSSSYWNRSRSVANVTDGRGPAAPMAARTSHELDRFIAETSAWLVVGSWVRLAKLRRRDSPNIVDGVVQGSASNGMGDESDTGEDASIAPYVSAHWMKELARVVGSLREATSYPSATRSSHSCPPPPLLLPPSVLRLSRFGGTKATESFRSDGLTAAL